jgi:hypothetical protein
MKREAVATPLPLPSQRLFITPAAPFVMVLLVALTHFLLSRRRRRRLSQV